MAGSDTRQQCTLDDIRRNALEIQRFWGSHLYVQVVHGASPAMDWRTVILPEDYVEWSQDQLMATMLHEWGHRMISPISPKTGAIWAKIGRKNGLSERQAKLMVNIATDLWLDNQYLNSRRWGALYRRGNVRDIEKLAGTLQKAREEGIGEEQLKVKDFLICCYEKMLAEGRNDESVDLNLTVDLLYRKEAEETWRILFRGSEHEEDRIAAFSMLLKQFLPEETEISFGDLLSDFHDFFPGMRGSGELTARIRARGRRGGLNSQDMESLFGEEIEKLRSRTSRLEMYKRIVPVVKNFLASRPRNQFWGYRTWRVGSPINKLDVLASSQRSPLLLPGINTLSKHFARKGTIPEAGAGAVILILDDSGSTDGDVLLREKEAAFAVIAAAREFSDPVGFLAFGDGVTSSVQLTTQYGEIEQAVAALNSESGGTTLGPALKEAYKMLSGIQKYTIMLMTDAGLFDFARVGGLVKQLPPASKIVAFCFGEKEYIERETRDLIGPQFRVLVSSPQRSFAEAALEEVYG